MKSHATTGNACRKTGEVTNDTATKSNHDIAALKTRGKDCIGYGFECCKTFGFLPGCNQDGCRIYPDSRQASREPIEMQTCDSLVADNSDTHRFSTLCNFISGPLDQSGPNENIVRTIPELDGYSGSGNRVGHEPDSSLLRDAIPSRWPAIACIASKAMISFFSSREFTTRSATE